MEALKEAKGRNEQAQLRVNGGSHVVFATRGEPLFPLIFSVFCDTAVRHRHIFSARFGFK